MTVRASQPGDNDHLAAPPVDRSFTVTSATTALEDWRVQHFGSPDNAGPGADDSDADADGEANLLEFATGQDPHAATRSLTPLVLAAGQLEFTYTRAKAAADAGVSYMVEYHDSLDPGPWIAAGPGTLQVEGSLQTFRAIVPAGSSGRRFLRLRVTAP